MRSRDMVGRSIGGFRIESLVGKGSSGVVFRAMQEAIRRPVALKILTSKWASDPTNLARFRREAISAAKIQHPHVVSVFDFGESNGLFYMAMTMVDGSSLSEHIKAKGALQQGFVVRMGYQLSSALSAIDQAGLIHRDIKPANIMIQNADASAILTDLGLAKAADNTQDITLKGFTVGTPNYIAPEQALAEEELTIGCDIYSLGATLYHAATGRLVFNRSNAFQVMKSHVKDKPKDPRSLNPNLNTEFSGLLLAMLEKAPGNRPSPDECLDVLAGVLEQFGGSPDRSRSNQTSKRTAERVAAHAEQRKPKGSYDHGEDAASEAPAEPPPEPTPRKKSKSKERGRKRNTDVSKNAKKSDPKSGKRRPSRTVDDGGGGWLIPLLVALTVILALTTLALLLTR